MIDGKAAPRTGVTIGEDSDMAESQNLSALQPAPQILSGRAVVTIIGPDRVGIIAGISNVLADSNVNIIDLSQSVMREFFVMIMMVDLQGANLAFDAVQARLDAKGKELSVRVEIQREEIFRAMHRI
jgi:ACT domain-containing protein